MTETIVEFIDSTLSQYSSQKIIDGDVFRDVLLDIRLMLDIELSTPTSRIVKDEYGIVVS
jgi:hypothetical protein